MKTKTIKNGAYTSLIRAVYRLPKHSQGYKMKSEELIRSKNFNLLTVGQEGRSQWYRQGNYFEGGSSHYQMRATQEPDTTGSLSFGNFPPGCKSMDTILISPDYPKQGLHSLRISIPKKSLQPCSRQVISCSRRNNLMRWAAMHPTGAVEDTICGDRAAIRESYPSAQKSRDVYLDKGIPVHKGLVI